MTRLRQQDAAYSRLQLALHRRHFVGSEAAIVVKQVEKNGIVSVTDQQWRDHAIAAAPHHRSAPKYASAMQAMGTSAGPVLYARKKSCSSHLPGWTARAAKAGNDELAAVPARGELLDYPTWKRVGSSS